MSDRFMPVLIREGKITGIVSAVEFEVSFSDPRKGEKTVIKNLPISGNGNSFLIAPPQLGTRVAVAFLGDQAKEPVMIIGMFPNDSQGQNDSTILPKNELPLGTAVYPKVNPGEIFLSSQSQNTIELLDNHLAITNELNRGLYLKTEGKYASMYLNANNYFSYGSGGRTFFGQARRFLDKTSGVSVKVTGVNENLDIDSITTPIGFFPKSITSRLSDLFDGRNIGLIEYKKIINEFDGEFFFDSFYGEIQKILKNKDEFSGAATYSKSKDPMNTLALSDGELIEIIAGNLLDINGNILDINYRKFLNGNDEGRVPPITNDLAATLDQLIRKSRRGIGFHFQLNTSNPPDNSEPERSKKYENNFVFDIDKEGAFRLNVPKTTPTGSVFFPIGATLGRENDGDVSSYQVNESKLEEIPVHLRDENGEPISPNLASLLEAKKRQTGVRFYNKDSSYPEGYFPFVENEELPDAFVRIQYTKHHDITKIAERLIANSIKSINRPGDNVDPTTGINSTIPVYSKPFESPNKDDVDMTTLPYSSVSVLPGPPGIRTGGDTIIAGKLRGFDPTEYPDSTSKRDLPLTNILNSVISEAGTTLTPEEEDSVQTSGRSSSINLEGSAEISVGKDAPDGKSLVLDTAGSLLAWFGKDENGRSMILQSDGEVIFNVGGTYDNATDASIASMNKGSFTLRVNVSDRGFYSSKYSSQEKKDLAYAEDYIIHISENGLLISGGAAEKDMIIRNTGDIILESSRGAVELRGSKIYATEHHKKKKDIYQVNDKLQK